MKLTSSTYSSVKRLASSTVANLNSSKTSAQRILTPKSSTLVTPSIGFQAAIRTYDFNRSASTTGGPKTVSSNVKPFFHI